MTEDWDPKNGWEDADTIELDPNGPTLEVTGPILEPDPREPHIAFMQKQVYLTDRQAIAMARQLGWTEEEVEVLMEIRNGRGYWC